MLSVSRPIPSGMPAPKHVLTPDHAWLPGIARIGNALPDFGKGRTWGVVSEMGVAPEPEGLKLDGSSGQKVTWGSFGSTNERTSLIVIRMDSPVGDTDMILEETSNAHLIIATPTGFLGIVAGGGLSPFVVPTVPSVGSWYVIALRASTIHQCGCCINGNWSLKYSPSGDLLTPGELFSGNDANSVEGVYAACMMWDRGLTDAEIALLMARPLAWLLDESENARGRR